MDHFLELGLDSKIIKTLNAIGFKQPTPIQEQAIPEALEKRDIFASAQTGTGKTCAFLLPALNAIATSPDKPSKAPQVLILVPTRELAEQVSKEAMRFSKNLPHVKTVCIYGGMPYPLQYKALSRPHQILVSTPGRLIDLMDRKKVNLSEINYLVLDEADRMLDMGFINDVEKIASATPNSRQTLLFSATLNRKVQEVSKNLQNDPFKITIKPDMSNSGSIDKRLYYVDNIGHKMRLLDSLLDDPEIKQAIVFTSTKVQADKLTTSLKDKGYHSAALHGDIHQRKRNQTLKGLRHGKIQILVATDVAARGIDVTTLTHVINFDIPRQAEDFIHRIGRTGRAGASGVAISFATYPEKRVLGEIEKLLGCEMKVHTVEGMEPLPEPKGGARRHSGRPSSQRPKRRFGGGGFSGSRNQRSRPQGAGKGNGQHPAARRTRKKKVVSCR